MRVLGIAKVARAHVGVGKGGVMGFGWMGEFGDLAKRVLQLIYIVCKFSPLWCKVKRELSGMVPQGYKCDYTVSPFVDERKLKRQRRSNPTGNLLIDPDCASRSCFTFGFPRSACVDYTFRPLARCKEACHDKTVSQTCCNQEHDGSRSEQHALRTRDLPGYNDLGEISYDINHVTPSQSRMKPAKALYKEKINLIPLLEVNRYLIEDKEEEKVRKLIHQYCLNFTCWPLPPLAYHAEVIYSETRGKDY
ncbi:hypothetical protein Tco_1568471 [Tanacetum coccineum]